MTNSTFQNEQAGSFSRRQQIIYKYVFFVLVDLTVLNLLDQYWDLVFIEDFTTSLLAALLLQVLLQLTMAIEHRIADYFREKPGVTAKTLRVFSTWAVLFGSKLVILQTIDISFGSSVLFGGPMQGLIAFVIVVVAIIVAEVLVYRLYKSLA